MGSSFSLCNVVALFTLLFLFVSNRAADAEGTNHINLLQNSKFRIHNTQAQRFIRGLNLSSRHDANIVQDELLHYESAEIVENPFLFPSLLSDSGPNNLTYLGHHAGYFGLPNTKGHARMFYYFFEARQNKAKAPVVVWLSGGPGCSGSLALFYENGPFKFADNSSLVWNDFGWDQVANMIYIDQPTGTGFSYFTNDDDIRNTSEEAAGDFYNFMQAFFRKHPELANNDFYITGESYAGHYIPAFAAQVHHGNKIKQGQYINLKGMAIGNGMTNSGVQYESYPDYAKNMNLINQSQYEKLKPLVSECLKKVNNVCGTRYNRTACGQVYLECDLILENIIQLNHSLNFYDIRKTCEGPLCYDLSSVERFLNQSKVKRALGVNERMEYVSCSDAVHDAMLGDEMRNLAVYVPELLDAGIKLLLYAGEYDLVCNWLGNSRWAHAMEWSGQKGFNAAANVTFSVNGVEAGSQKSYGNLTFLIVGKAGHLVPMDQPIAALHMLDRWMQGYIPL